jgi:hypothetical protein
MSFQNHPAFRARQHRRDRLPADLARSPVYWLFEALFFGQHKPAAQSVAHADLGDRTCRLNAFGYRREPLHVTIHGPMQ